MHTTSLPDVLKNIDDLDVYMHQVYETKQFGELRLFQASRC